MKILFAEDDRELARSVIDWLKTDHFDVAHYDNGQSAFKALESEEFDLLLLDWELPDLSGLEICRRYRAKKGNTPVIILTGRAAIDDRVTGLDVGADDYISKPFSLKELSARIRALLRRPPQLSSVTIEVGKLKLDPIKYRLTVNGRTIQLMPRDFALLEFLMRNPDRVFSTDALLNRVWSEHPDVGPEALRTSIKRIRKKIDSSENEQESMIENIPRVGYRLRFPE